MTKSNFSIDIQTVKKVLEKSPPENFGGPMRCKEGVCVFETPPYAFLLINHVSSSKSRETFL